MHWVFKLKAKNYCLQRIVEIIENRLEVTLQALSFVIKSRSNIMWWAISDPVISSKIYMCMLNENMFVLLI